MKKAMERLIIIAMLITTAFSGVPGNSLNASASSKWSKKTVTVSKGIYTFEAHLSQDKKSAWVYKVTSSKKNAKNTLAFPAKIKGAKLTRIMSDTSKYNDEEFVKSVFDSWVEPAHDYDGANSVSKKIAKISIPDTVEEIGYCALSGLNSVKTITLPKSLKKIEDWAFGGCESLTSLSVPANFTDSFVYAFANTKKLSNISVDAANKMYCSENGMLYNATKSELIWVAPAIKDVVISKQVTTIKESAFYFSQAKQVKIPASVKKMEANSFAGCRHVTAIDLDENNTVYKQDGNTIYKDSDKSLEIVVAKNKRAIISNQVTLITDRGNIVGSCTRVDIPASVTTVMPDWYDFMRSYMDDDEDTCYVEEVYCHMTTPPTVVNKKGKAYRKKDYEDLNLVDVSDTYFVPKESIKQYKKWCPDGQYKTFYNGTEEKNESFEYTKGKKYIEITNYIGTANDVVIPNQIDGIAVVSIAANAFLKKDIVSVVIPDTVKEIGAQAFRECANLKSVTLSRNCSVIGYKAFFGCRQLETIKIPDSVKKLNEACFMNCEGLKSITFGTKVTTIERKCFKNCKSFVAVKLPDHLKYIDSEVFRGCTALKTIKLNNGLEDIYPEAFRDCTSLSGITIPKKVSYIYSDTFKNCKSLKSVNFKGTMKGFASEAFANCKKLKSIKGKVVITKGVEAKAFKGCKNCKATFTVKKNSHKISKSAFQGCKKITLKYVK